MKTETQTPAAATQFTGVAGAGLISFAGVTLPAGDIDVTVIILGVALETNGAVIPTIDCFLFPPSATLTTTQRYTIRRLNATENAAASGFSLVGCHIPVPRFIRGAAGLELWNLALITTGKDAVASLVVSYDLGKVLPEG